VRHPHCRYQASERPDRIARCQHALNPRQVKNVRNLPDLMILRNDLLEIEAIEQPPLVPIEPLATDLVNRHGAVIAAIGARAQYLRLRRPRGMAGNGMSWPCSYPTSKQGGMGHERSTAMSSTSSSAVTMVGIDIGKSSFHVIGLDERGPIVLRQRWARGRLEARRRALESRNYMKTT
jgi:hypothetical protein